jgi:cobalamin synthase
MIDRRARNWAFFTFIVVAAGIHNAWFAGGNLVAMVATIAATIACVALAHGLSRKVSGPSFTIETLRLGKKGFGGLATFLIVLYLLEFILNRAEYLPAWPVILVTVALYVPFCLLLWVNKPASGQPRGVEVDAGKIIPAKAIYFFLLSFLLAAIAFFFAPVNLTYILGIATYVSFAAIGVTIFCIVIKRVIANQK